MRSVRDNPVGDVPVQPWSPAAAKMIGMKAMARPVCITFAIAFMSLLRFTIPGSFTYLPSNSFELPVLCVPLRPFLRPGPRAFRALPSPLDPGPRPSVTIVTIFCCHD